jgi:hypothetical protein
VTAPPSALTVIRYWDEELVVTVIADGCVGPGPYWSIWAAV